MKTLIVILVLFSSTVFAEVFNCEMTLTSDKFGTQKYKLLVDIGNDSELLLTTQSYEGELTEIIQQIQSVGKIYFDVGHPYGLRKEDSSVYFTAVNKNEKLGFFFIRSASTININKINKEGVWKIFISDSDTNFDLVQKGICK